MDNIEKAIRLTIDYFHTCHNVYMPETFKEYLVTTIKRDYFPDIFYPKPLTLEELKTMDDEVIWLGIDGEPAEPFLLCFSTCQQFSFLAFGSNLYLKLESSNINIRWIAYKNKPREEK